MGLTINCRKTKTLAGLSYSYCLQPQPVLLSPSADPVESVSAFQYLGSTVSQDCNNSAEVSPRLSRPRRHLAHSTKGCGCRRGSRLLLNSMFTIPSSSQLSYNGLECTVLLEPEVSHLQSFLKHCIHTILSISIWNSTCNTSTWKAAKQQWVSSLLSQRRLCFAGHLIHMSDNRSPQTACLFSAFWQTLYQWPKVRMAWPTEGLETIGLGDDW